MTFVLAGALVVLVVLVVTLVKMFPLDRAQIFFLTSEQRENTQIKLSSFTPDAENLEAYKTAFLKEYVRARNEISENQAYMQRKWSATPDGNVWAWSSPEVYNQFQNTGMYIALMNDIPDFPFSCPVEFRGIQPRSQDVYAVSFSYFCTNNNDGQTTRKDYTISIKLEREEKIAWADRLGNPLGIHVVEYQVEGGNRDPLDMF